MSFYVKEFPKQGINMNNYFKYKIILKENEEYCEKCEGCGHKINNKVLHGMKIQKLIKCWGCKGTGIKNKK